MPKQQQRHKDIFDVENIIVAPQLRSKDGICGAWAPLRIEVRLGTIAELNAEKRALLVDELIPKATAYLSNALAVKPWPGALRAARTCAAHFEASGVCASEGPAPTCAIGARGGSVGMPADLLDALKVCSSCTTTGSCSDCATSPAGAGADADFVFFVSAVTTAACTGGALAYSGTCQRDELDRPIFGAANFCPAALSVAPADFEAQTATVVHELVHALGFSQASWPLFRDDDGKPRTPRGADGLPPLVSTTCVDGVTRMTRKPSSNTVVTDSTHGLTVNRMVTPRVAAMARELFGCSTITGAELEHKPASDSHCYGSHWEQHLFSNELMAPADNYVSKSQSHGAMSIRMRSTAWNELTLAALEDSGWYKASNHSAREYLPFSSRGKGCGHVAEVLHQDCLRALREGRATYCDVR